MSHGMEGVRKKKRREVGGGDYKGYRYPTSPTPQLATYPLPYFFSRFYKSSTHSDNGQQLSGKNNRIIAHRKKEKSDKGAFLKFVWSQKGVYLFWMLP